MHESLMLDKFSNRVSFLGTDRKVKWTFFRDEKSGVILDPESSDNLGQLDVDLKNGNHLAFLVNRVFDDNSQPAIELLNVHGKLWDTGVFPVFNSSGGFSGVLLSSIKINETNKIDDCVSGKSVSESEIHLSTLVSNLPGIVYRCKNDSQWTMEFVSQGCFELTGYHPEDLINNKNLSFNDLIDPIYQDEIWNNWQIAIQKKKAYTGEYQIITSEGKKKWVWEKGQAQYGLNDEVESLEGFIQDITDRKNAEIALSKSEEKNRSLIEGALVGIYTTKINGEILAANEALSRMLEFESTSELLAITDIRSLFKTPADRDRMLEIIQKKGKISDFELILMTKYGKEIYVIISAILSTDIISGMIMDITERKLAEFEILEQKEKAEQSDKLKAAFLANISHEIRTPLNGILGFTEILLEQDISSIEKKEYSKMIHNLSSQLLSIVSDIMEISRIETNQIEIVSAQININQILYKLFNNFEKPAKEKSLVLSLNSELKENQSIVYGDEFRLVQVLTHLLNNAIKFTNSGYINFGCRVFNQMLQFFVSDTGIGILPEHREIIFERFRQIEDSLTRKYGGSGLGLSISKALVEMMGGEIYIDPYPEIGSTFYINIPFQQVPQLKLKQRNPLETKSCLNECNILVCEDDDFGFLYINRLLTQAGATTVRAKDGKMAINICQSEEKLDLILMDLRLPEMSGNEVAAYIRKIRPTIPVVICTASSHDEIDHLLRDNLFDDYILKPIVLNNLLETICRLLPNPM